jgi:hypothetical protein
MPLAHPVPVGLFLFLAGDRKTVEAKFREPYVESREFKHLACRFIGVGTNADLRTCGSDGCTAESIRIGRRCR